MANSDLGAQGDVEPLYQSEVALIQA
jgi:hypothetical protein